MPRFRKILWLRNSLLGDAVDLRVKVGGYQYDIGDRVYGWRAGADLTTRDNVFSFRYEHGEDRINGSYDRDRKSVV